MSVKIPAKFPLGRVVSTLGALEACSREYLAQCLQRHVQGDWGVVDAHDVKFNERALREDLRLLSAYPIDPADATKGNIWIITEADRSATTFLLPSEY